MDNARRARRGLIVFFAVLIPLSGLVEALILRRSLKLPRGVLILVLMWIPALASVVARVAAREGFGDHMTIGAISGCVFADAAR